MALLISNSADLHVDLLAQAANEQEIAFFRLNTDHFRHNGGVRLAFGPGHMGGELSFGDKSVNVNDVNLVVYRRPERAYDDDTNASQWKRRIVDQEWKRVDEVLSVLAVAQVMNPLGASAVARNKLAQLVYACRADLHIPSSLVTTNRQDFRNFLDDHNPVVTKGISASYVIDGDIVRTGFTRRIRGLDERYDPRGCPTLLQESIPAAAVWRIVVIDNAVYGVRYTGPELQEVADARLVHDRLRGEARDVPGDVARGIRCMCESLGILFCSADFVEAPDGRLVFLDLNPDGQWAWLQLEFGLPLAGSIVALARKPAARTGPGIENDHQATGRDRSVGEQHHAADRAVPIRRKRWR